MDHGAFADARAELLALAADAAPHPVPAEQVIALLKEGPSDDAEAVGRLAYRALTGVDPGPTGQPAERPSDVLPGFPAFAAEVLTRAVNGPDDRRPTAAALVVVLETTPASAWPTRAVEAEVPEAEVEVEADAPEAEVQDEAEVELEAEVDPGALAEPQPAGARATRGHADDHAGLHEDFRRVVAPVHAVPRFDPLEGAGELPMVSHDLDRPSRQVRRRRRTSSASSEERRQTLIMVGVILVLILVGALYALSHDATDESAGDELPPPAQGASRTQLQPSSALPGLS